MTRILVIEPERSTRAAMRQILEGAGYEVDEAADGNGGSDSHRSRPVDLVIADPDHMADRRDLFAGARFIAVPGNGRSGCSLTAEAARRMGAQQLLPKPFRRDDLLSAVRNSLGASPAL